MRIQVGSGAEQGPEFSKVPQERGCVVPIPSTGEMVNISLSVPDPPLFFEILTSGMGVLRDNTRVGDIVTVFAGYKSYVVCSWSVEAGWRAGTIVIQGSSRAKKARSIQSDACNATI